MLRCKSGRGLLLAAVISLLAAPAPADAAVDLVVRGHGFGHGVGMSQWGAEGYALHGASYRQIIAHYYPGTLLGRQPETSVRVLLAADRRRFGFDASAPVRIAGRVRPAGSYRLVAARLSAARPLILSSTQPLAAFGRHWRGQLLLFVHAGRLDVINRLPLEQYLRGVVPAEMPSSWQPQALAAQAVAARSFARASLKPAGEFDLYGDTRSQAYGGVDAESAAGDAAVATTAGQVALYHGQVATTFFDACSGGRTAAVEDAWPGAAPLPYLRSVRDPYDTIAPEHAWSVVVPAARLHRALPAWPEDWTTFTLTHNPSGRVDRLEVAGASLDATAFAAALQLNSTWFTLGALSLQRTASSVEVQTFAVGPAVLEEQTAAGWQPLRQLPADAQLSLPLTPGAYRLQAGDALGQMLLVPAA